LQISLLTVPLPRKPEVTAEQQAFSGFSSGGLAAAGEKGDADVMRCWAVVAF
jgi:hypothetical protein